MRARRQVVLMICGTPFLKSVAARAAGTDSVPTSAQMQPAQLVDMLKAGARPTILQVGFKTLYDQAHIPGAIYAGPGNKEDGLANLKAQVEKLPHDGAVVIYCGCCPWVRCPNMGPAWDALHAMGFTNVKALHIATNFGEDWVKKDYPVARGQ
jgi:3-mercaptopyruvate sulfurtransferase SseA